MAHPVDASPVPPGIRVLREESDRLSLAWDAVGAGQPDRMTTAVVGGLTAFCGLVVYGATRDVGAFATWGGAAVGVGLAGAGAVWLIRSAATVRVHVKRTATGAAWVRRSAGVGPFRMRRGWPGDRLRAVALGFPPSGNPDADVDLPRTAAFSVVRDRPAWLARWIGGSASLLARVDGPDAAALAAHVAGRVAAKLTALGWRPDVPHDWRFGWRDAGPSDRLPG